MERNLRIGEILLKLKTITEEQLNEALAIQSKDKKKRLGEILIERKFTTEEILGDALAQAFHMPFVDISTQKIDKEAVGLLPPDILKKYQVFPLRVEGNHLMLATSDPSDILAIQEISRLSGYSIKLVIAPISQIDSYINKYAWSMQYAAEVIEEIASREKGQEITKNPELSLEKIETASQDVPIIKLINNIIAEAIEQRASDIHFEPQEKGMLVRFRIDGILYDKVDVPKGLQSEAISRVKIMSGMDISEKRKPQDGRIGISMRGREFDVRVSTLPGMFGEKVVLRLLDKKSALLSVDSLGMDENELKQLNSLIYRPYGIILFTGPTGSGKTTSLYSILNAMNDSTKNIVTIEDPVEYGLVRITQTTINVRAGYTFANAMKHVLRQDPDIIMVGEIRDLETTEIAIQAALTGHLVLSTLHTNNAAGAITRLLDMSAEPFLISSALIGVVAQRLVRKLCPFCAKEYEVSKDLKMTMPDIDFSHKEKLILMQSSACEKCGKKGYLDRTGIFEILTMSEEIRKLILNKANEAEITAMAVSQGMRTLKESGIRKALNKITSLEEVVRVVSLDKK